MGCGKIREVHEANIELNPVPENNEAPNQDTSQEVEKSEIEEVKIESREFRDFIKVLSIKKENHDEIGKVGEDSEAGEIDKGKKREHSFEINLKKVAMPKKLPPISNPPMLALIPSTVSKFAKHRPDIEVIKDLLAEEDVQKFDDLEYNEVDADDGSISKIMRELDIHN